MSWVFFDWPKSWIRRTLGQGKCFHIFWKWHFHNASKEVFWPEHILNFMHGFKSAILSIFQFCQSDTFEPGHEIWNFFWPKAFFWSIMKMAIKFFFVTFPRVCQIQDLCRKKYKKGIFSDVQWWKQISTHFSDSTHQECLIFARIGHGSCYYHWNEIFAVVSPLPVGEQLWSFVIPEGEQIIQNQSEAVCTLINIGNIFLETTL